MSLVGLVRDLAQLEFVGDLSAWLRVTTGASTQVTDNIFLQEFCFINSS